MTDQQRPHLTVSRRHWVVLALLGVLVVAGVLLGALVSPIAGGALVALCGIGLAGVTLWVARDQA